MHKQHGLSIIEMMVALLISSFLIIGITQVYLDNRENTLFQQSQGQNIDNARFSILLLEQTLAKAGYRRAPDETMETAFPSDSIGACGPMGAGQVVKRMSATSFCIRYQPAFPDARDCAGDNIPNIPASPYIATAPVTEIFDLNDGNLTCRQAGGAEQELASNVEGLKLLYGSNNNEEKRIETYSETPEKNIRAVHFSIMTASSTEVAKSPGSAAYKFWHKPNTEGAEEPDPEDKRLYTMLSSSTSMRNLMP
ncbi:MAG: PilW family protein [Gammaproteobacteria bacterium]|nr:PilW family protein [Gammaproteobacteria bacterium]MBU0851591.1 PilW family protein [Gammaproteobacteria bacterium]MBU1774649.1 PilW family protein [Gammaproteobacteria bacterium]|tara:strand:- start:14088 stop:14843 length:756 start_codon:yes stop_codon:yes gene_type:complete